MTRPGSVRGRRSARVAGPAGGEGRHVVWTRAAARDLVEIVSYVARRSPANARRLLTRLRSKADSLARDPGRGRVVPELGATGSRVWRELVARPHRIIYRIGDDIVLVAAVLDGRRELEDLLLARLTRGD